MIPPEQRLLFGEILRTISYILMRRLWAEIAYYMVYIDMVLTDAARDYFLSIQFRVRKAAVTSLTSVPFTYENEPFFSAYQAVTDVLVNWGQVENVDMPAHSQVE